MEEATWEHEDTVHANYSFLFEDEGMFVVIYIKLLLHVHVIIYGTLCEF